MTFVTNKSQLQTNQKPHCPRKGSYKVHLQHGQTYFWCTCGLSNQQPFCDGSHTQKPGFKPLKFTYEGADGIRGLCGCKQNENESGPFCDGSHRDIPDW